MNKNHSWCCVPSLHRAILFCAVNVGAYKSVAIIMVSENVECHDEHMLTAKLGWFSSSDFSATGFTIYNRFWIIYLNENVKDVIIEVTVLRIMSVTAAQYFLIVSKAFRVKFNLVIFTKWPIVADRNCRLIRK